jgi:predicted DNA-binding protein
MARSDPQVNIRMPQALKERLESATIETNRSLNGEIVARLEESFEDRMGPMDLSEKSLIKIEDRVMRPLEKLIKERK